MINQRRNIVRLLIAASLLATAIPVQANPSCVVSVRDDRLGELFGRSGDCPLDTGDVLNPFVNATVSGRAAAGAGFLQARFVAFGRPENAGAIATFTIPAISFPSTDPSTAGIDSIPAALRLHVNGSIQLTEPDRASSSHVQVFLNVTYNARSAFDSSYSIIFGGPTTATGVFAGLSGDSIDGTFTNSGASMSTHSPVQMEVAMGVAGQNASADFFNTIHFPSDGPVFDLPAGFTANSADGSIVNNRWTGGPQAVPGPSTWMLMGLGMVSLLIKLRRREQPTA